MNKIHSLFDKIPKLSTPVKEILVRFIPILSAITIVPSIIVFGSYKTADFFGTLSQFIPLTKQLGILFALPVTIFWVPYSMIINILGQGPIRINKNYEIVIFLIVALFGLFATYLLFRRNKIIWVLLTVISSILCIVLLFSGHVAQFIFAFIGLYILLQVKEYYK